MQELKNKQRQELGEVLTEQIELGDRYFEEILNQNHVDLVEVCAPWDSPLCQAVRDLGGTALALGLHNGFDLNTVQGYKRALAVVRQLKPKYVHISPPCHLWSSFQNCNPKQGQVLQEFLQARGKNKKLIARCCRILEVQLFELNGHGSHAHSTYEDLHHGGGEHPLNAQSWKHTQLGHMARRCGGRFTVYGCCHGMYHKTTKKLL